MGKRLCDVPNSGIIAQSVAGKKLLTTADVMTLSSLHSLHSVMPRKNANSGKHDALRRQRCLNPRPERVADSLFQQRDFFDAHDLVQVKYEMLRRVQMEQKPVSEAAAAFGFSRPSYYQAELDFQKQGLVGLIPEKPGPRKAHKLTAEVLEYVQQIRAKQPSWDMTQLATAIQERFGIPVHPRSIERALERQEKKRR